MNRDRQLSEGEGHAAENVDHEPKLKLVSHGNQKTNKKLKPKQQKLEHFLTNWYSIMQCFCMYSVDIRHNNY